MKLEKKIYDKKEIIIIVNGHGESGNKCSDHQYGTPRHGAPDDQPALRRSLGAQRGSGVCLRTEVVGQGTRHVRLVERRLATALLACGWRQCGGETVVR